MQVDFLPSKAMTPEELQAQRELVESMAKATRTITTMIDTKPETVELFIKFAFKTNGGWMFDVAVTFEEKETQHRVIVGRDYYEDFGIEPEQVLDRVFAFLLRKRVPRHTEGASVSDYAQDHSRVHASECYDVELNAGLHACRCTCNRDLRSLLCEAPGMLPAAKHAVEGALLSFPCLPRNDMQVACCRRLLSVMTRCLQRPPIGRATVSQRALHGCTHDQLRMLSCL